MFKKLLISFLLAVYLLTSLSVSYVKADTNPWYSQGLQEWYTRVYNKDNPEEIFGERYTAAQVDWIIWSVLTWLPTKIVGPDLIVCVVSKDMGECLGTLIHLEGSMPNPQIIAVNNDNNLLSSIFKDRPLSGITYIKNLGRKFHLIPEAKAQVKGFGFENALLPIQDMWKASRNVAYTLFVLVIIVLSFMIMFRVKISPQVVISVQSALPKLILALILVTFSYAIAGFLVDLMYVVIGIISLLAKGFFPFEVSSTAIFDFLTKGRLFLLGDLGIMGLFVVFLILFAVLFLVSMIFLFGPVGSAVVGALAAFGLAISGVGIPLLIILSFVILTIILIVLLWMIILTIWTIFKAYASVLLLTIFAPFQITLGVLVPAIGFGRWIKSFISNLAIFVTIGFLFLLAYIFLIQGFVIALNEYLSGDLGDLFLKFFVGAAGAEKILSSSSSSMWPPLLGIPGNSGVALLFLGVSFMIFTIIPKTASLIKSFIEEQPFSYGAAIGQIIAPAVPYVGYATGKMGQRGWPIPVPPSTEPKPGGRLAGLSSWLHRLGAQRRLWPE